MSCSRTQRSDASEARTSTPTVSSQHFTTEQLRSVKGSVKGSVHNLPIGRIFQILDSIDMRRQSSRVFFFSSNEGQKVEKNSTAELFIIFIILNFW